MLAALPDQFLHNVELGAGEVRARQVNKVACRLKRQWRRPVLIGLFAILSIPFTGALSAQASSPWAMLARTNDQYEPSEKTEGEEHALSQKAIEITRILSFPITNSMIVTWIVGSGLIVFVRIATRKMNLVPDGSQNALEWLLEQLYVFLEGFLGQHLVGRTFWFFATLFIFILATNWFGLIPGVGTVGWGYETSHGFRIDQPLLRSANADVNLTMAMALVFFACWIVWAIREIGPLGVVKELFAPKGESSGALKILLAVVFFAVGCLEIISILFRPVSLSFRLYGNIFAGENMLETMANLIPALSWLLPVPFYLLELLVGLVQALVFMLLTAVFTLLICQHESDGLEAAHN